VVGLHLPRSLRFEQFLGPFRVFPSSLLLLRRRARRGSGGTSNRGYWTEGRKSFPGPISGLLRLTRGSSRRTSRHTRSLSSSHPCRILGRWSRSLRRKARRITVIIRDFRLASPGPFIVPSRDSSSGRSHEATRAVPSSTSKMNLSSYSTIS
jgi:hypothetical protein